MIKGQTVTLYEVSQTGIDEFNNPFYEETAIEVGNVLIEPASNDAIVSELQLTGKKVVYILHIPKGDTHDWKDAKVYIPSIGIFKTFGDCLVYDEALTPLSWNKKVKVERYE